MKFKSGMLGLCIVVLALFGTILAGFCLDVESQTRTVTNYEYVTDVTGLFDIGNAPQYIEYNPSSNYTGYAYDTVNYTDAGSINQYRYVKTQGATTTATYTLTYEDSLTQDTNFFVGTQYGSNAYINWTGPNYPMGNTVTQAGITRNIVLNNKLVGESGTYSLPNVSTMDKVLTELGVTDSYQSATITVTNNAVGGQTYPVIITPYDWALTTTSYRNVYSITLTDGSAGNNCDVASMDYNTATTVLTAYDSNNNKLWEKSANQVMVIYDYESYRTGSLDTATCSTTFTATLTDPPGYSYMDPSTGVTMKSSPATWTNGYENSEITITVGKNTASANNLVITAGSSWVSVTRSSGGYITVAVHGDNGNDSKSLGLWDAVQLRLNLSVGTVSVTPIIGSISYINPITENGSTVTFDNWYSAGDRDNLTFSCTGTSMAWGITRTLVFLNTYGAVMSDPSITISDQFPDLNAWRLNFYSFATVGESMTVNGQTFDIGPGQTITVTNGSDTISGTLTDIYVSKDLDGHIIFSFNGGKSIDLGEAVSDTISFTGLWYFTTGLFNAYQGTEEYYNWNIDSLWHATGEQAIVIFLGLLALGVIFAKMVLKANIGIMDGLALLFGAIICFAVGGVII